MNTPWLGHFRLFCFCCPLWSPIDNAHLLPNLMMACWSDLYWAFLTTWRSQGHWQVDMLIADFFLCMHYSSLLRRKMPCQEKKTILYLLHYTVRKDEPSHLTASKPQCSVTLTAPSALAEGDLWPQSEDFHWPFNSPSSSMFCFTNRNVERSSH